MPERSIRVFITGDVQSLWSRQINRRRRHPTQIVNETVISNPEQPGLEIARESVRHHIGSHKRFLCDVIGQCGITAQRGQEPPQLSLTRPRFGDEPLPGHSLSPFENLFLFGLDFLFEHLSANEIDNKKRKANSKEDTTEEVKKNNYIVI